jgi:uncharacterized protein YqgC (DUF456 family)
MSIALAVIGWTLFGLAILAGLLLDLVGLFGNWVILGAVAIAWPATGFDHFGGWAVITLAALALFGEIVEMIAASFGAKKFGGSKGGAVAAMIGCIIGAIVASPMAPIIGTVIGACAGAFIAAALYEAAIMRKGIQGSVRIGFGAALGKIGGMLGKMLVGFLMLFVAALTF